MMNNYDMFKKSIMMAYNDYLRTKDKKYLSFLLSSFHIDIDMDRLSDYDIEFDFLRIKMLVTDKKKNIKYKSTCNKSGSITVEEKKGDFRIQKFYNERKKLSMISAIVNDGCYQLIYTVKRDGDQDGIVKRRGHLGYLYVKEDDRDKNFEDKYSLLEKNITEVENGDKDTLIETVANPGKKIDTSLKKSSESIHLTDDGFTYILSCSPYARGYFSGMCFTNTISKDTYEKIKPVRFTSNLYDEMFSSRDITPVFIFDGGNDVDKHTIFAYKVDGGIFAEYFRNTENVEGLTEAVNTVFVPSLEKEVTFLDFERVCDELSNMFSRDTFVKAVCGKIKKIKEDLNEKNVTTLCDRILLDSFSTDLNYSLEDFLKNYDNYFTLMEDEYECINDEAREVVDKKNKPSKKGKTKIKMYKNNRV